jgi:TatD DNase family protein
MNLGKLVLGKFRQRFTFILFRKSRLHLTMLIDTHCHLDFPDYESDREEVIKRARQQDIGCIINIGSSLRGSRAGIDLARQYDFIYASVGIHPHEADKVQKQAMQEIQQLSAEPKVVAVGEIGLDYYKGLSSVENQKLLFINQLGLARQRSLPAIIHCRQAQEDTFDILKKENISSGVMHCFSGDKDFLEKILDLGFYVSFTCNLTYRKADNLRSVAKLAPLERLLLETDAPFLSPEGLRGRRNEPAFVKYIAEEISKIKGIDVAEVARVTTNNAKSLFKLNL